MPKIKLLVAICLSAYCFLSACNGQSSSNSSVNEDFELPEELDEDGDGRVDDFEPDADGDGIVDGFEPIDGDRDGDGVPDSEDFIDNRVAQDTNGDGFLDDFDGDGIPDFQQ